MGFFDFVESPIAGAEPCGPDLLGEQDFDGVMAALEHRLPNSYMAFSDPNRTKESGDEKPTVLRPGFKLVDELAPLLTLLKKSRDLRLLLPAAQMCLFAGDMESFGRAVAAMAGLLNNYWVEVHPRGEGKDFTEREVLLSGLASVATIEMPLKYAPIDITRRYGPVSFRTQLLAAKIELPQPKEVVLTEDEIRDVLVKSENGEQIGARYEAIGAAATGFSQMRELFAQHAPRQTPNFKDMPRLCGDIRTFLAGILSERNPEDKSLQRQPEAPAGALGQEEPANAAPASGANPIRSAAEATAALKAIDAFFSSSEPSNPAGLLVRQAQQVLGKSFIEAMQILNPSLADRVAVKIEGDVVLTISSSQLRLLAEGAPPDGGGEAAAASNEVAVTSRAAALSNMDAIAKYFLAAEPSSPVPMLLGRARSYCGKSFAALLKELTS